MKIIPLLTLKCPNCHSGKMYRGIFSLHKNCAKCQLDFEPEDGYYTGAMVFNWLFSVLFLTPIWLYLLFTGWSLMEMLTIIIGVLIILTPLLVRYTRAIWLHLDFAIHRRMES